MASPRSWGIRRREVLVRTEPGGMKLARQPATDYHHRTPLSFANSCSLTPKVYQIRYTYRSFQALRWLLAAHGYLVAA